MNSNDKVSRDRKVIMGKTTEKKKYFVEASLSYMSDKTYASCRNNEFNRFSECKKCKLR